MIRISVDFRASRARREGCPGEVVLRLSGLSAKGGWGKVCVNVGIRVASREEAIEQFRRDIVGRICTVARIVEELADKEAVTVERLGSLVRQQLRKHSSASECRPEDRIVDKPVLRGDLVRVAPPFYDEFLFVSVPVKEDEGAEGLFGYLEGLVVEVGCKGQISTARGYRSLSRKLKRWWGNGEIPWSMVNGELVVGFSEWLVLEKLKGSTQSFYLRLLRTLLFRASGEGLCEASPDWFVEVNTSIRKGRRRIKSVVPDKSVLRRIASLDTEGEKWLALARDMFMFAFYCEGMELVDVAYLTSENIEGKELVFRRRRVGREVRLRLPREARAILRRYKGSGEYLFPLLGGGVLFASRRGSVALLLKEIGNRVGCPNLTFGSNLAAWKDCFPRTKLVENMI